MRLSALVCLLIFLGDAIAEAPVPATKDTAFDKNRLYVRWIVDLQPLALDGEEREPFEDVLLHAHGFKAGELLSVARSDISLSEMLHKDRSVREDVRFELVYIEGKLKRLKKIPSLALLREAGIEDIYEAWIFPNGSRGADPVCIIVSEPPVGVQPADDFTPGVPVTTAGYFFKVLEYQSGQANPKDPERTLFRRAPLLLGRSITISENTKPANASISDLATLSLVFGGAVLTALVGLALWLRRTDGGNRRAVSHRLRNPYNQPPIESTSESGSS